MKIHFVEQGSVDWLLARAGVITASEADALVSPTGKVRDGAGVATYLHKKLTELWSGGPLPSLQGVFDMDNGALLEERAKPAFTIHTGLETTNVGFITSDDGKIGCSPDALVGTDSGCEIKCCTMPVAIGYLLNGKMPLEYTCQVQFSLFVTGFKSWHFFSYNRQLPALHVVVERDERFQAALAVAVADFIAALDAGMKRLEELNGGPPPRRTVPAPQPEPPSDDLIP